MKMNDMINAYSDYFQRYFDFSGRTTRANYWWVVLVNIIIGFVLGFLGSLGEIISIVYSLVTIIPGLAIVIRRLHDTNRSGWNLLWLLLPIFGWVILLFYLIQPTAE